MSSWHGHFGIWFSHLLALLTLTPSSVVGAELNFTRGTEPASKFGVHEVALVAGGPIDDPLDVPVNVTFTPPSGADQSKTVSAFFDGGGIWRARVYVSEPGPWTWSSSCPSDPRLDRREGSFAAQDSHLRGRLLPHPRNHAHWMTEDGRWFLNINDTAYFLLLGHDRLGDPISFKDAQDYVIDAASMGITSVRANAMTAPNGTWEDYFEEGDPSRLNLRDLQRTDQRLEWMLNSWPDVYVQLILFPLAQRYGADETFWNGLSETDRERLLRNLVARFAAYPQIFWLVVNDCHYGDRYPNNAVLARTAGRYLMQHDPWQHPRSTGPRRRMEFPFPDEDWATYLHLEHEHDLAAREIEKYRSFGKPVFLGEDRYEQDHAEARDPLDMRYWQRRLVWAWLLAGGSTNYGGRWWTIHPYHQTGARTAFIDLRSLTFRRGLSGLDSVAHIPRYFADRGIELSDYEPDDALVHDPDGTSSEVDSPKLARSGNESYLIYHPNAKSAGQTAVCDPIRLARIEVDLSGAQGSFSVEWFDCHEGATQAGDVVRGGESRVLEAPWKGRDVVLRLSRIH